MAVIEPEEFGVSNSILLDNVNAQRFVENLKYRFARGKVSKIVDRQKCLLHDNL